MLAWDCPFCLAESCGLVDIDVTGCPLKDDKTLPIAKAPSVDWNSNWGDTPWGYNMFSNPFDFKIDWSNSQIIKTVGESTIEYTLAEAADADMISPYAYTYDFEDEQYEIITSQTGNSSDTISTWQGFWFIQLDSVSNLQLKFPYQKVLSKITEADIQAKPLKTLGPKYSSQKASVLTSWDWFLKIGVASQDWALQDMENGIGVSANSSDNLDGWDAPDIPKLGKNIQLSFLHDNNRAFAYDLHSDFTKESEWMIRISSNSENERFNLYWPQLRLIREDIKFSLFDSERAELLSDLKNARGYQFDLIDSIETFYIKAEKVSDENTPEFYFAMSQNPLLPEDVTIYIIPSEPLENIEASIDGISVQLKEVSSPPNIYYAKYSMHSGSNFTVNVAGTDYAGKDGSGTFTTTGGLMKTSETARIIEPGTGLELIIPEGALAGNLPLIFTRCPMDLSIPPEMNPLGNPIIISPDKIRFRKPALLHFPGKHKNDGRGLFKYSNGKWQYIDDLKSYISINGSGIYQLFEQASKFKNINPVIKQISINEAYPNSFNNATMMRYCLDVDASVSIIIYDLLGHKVRELRSGEHKAGYHTIKWNGKNDLGINVSSGNYFVLFKVKNANSDVFKDIKKITYIK